MTTLELPDADASSEIDLIEPAYEDYWGFDDQRTFYLPDKKQFITFKVMSEGDRKKFQQKTRTDITLVRRTGDATMRMSPADERHALIVSSVTGWSLFRRNPKTNEMQPVPFSKDSPGANLEMWLQVANPRIIDDLEKEIRKSNPWLLGEMTVEDIDKEIANLHEMREIALKREAGEESSSVK